MRSLIFLKKSLIFLLIIFLFSPRVVFAQVVINEILPNPSSGGNEWVELYNLGSETASLSGWLLEDNAHHAKSLDSLGEILASGFVVYEYTGDGWLNNSGGDTIYLKDNTGSTVDNYSYGSDPGEGKSFGRSPNGTGGFVAFDVPTKGVANPTPTPTPTPSPTPTPTLTPTPTPTLPPPTPTSTKTPMPTLTVTPKISTPTPIQKISPTTTPKKSNQTATDSGEVLGEEVSTISAFYPYEATDEAEKNEATPSARNKILPKIFLIGGLLLLFVSACWVWYNFRRN